MLMKMMKKSSMIKYGNYKIRFFKKKVIWNKNEKIIIY